MIELLIIIGIIAILAVAVMVAINPGRQFAAARDATRERHLSSLRSAFLSYQVEKGHLPIDLEYGKEICNTKDFPNCPEHLVDISDLSPNYISSIPIDPMGGVDPMGVGYEISIVNSEIVISSMHGETRNIGSRVALSFQIEEEEVFVEIPDDDVFDIQDEITLEAWIYPNVDTGNTLYRAIAGKYDTAEDERAYQLSINAWSGGEVEFWVSSDGDVRDSVEYPFKGGVWQHVAGVYDGDELKIFINGEKKASKETDISTINTNEEPFIIGSDNVFWRFWRGEIYEVRLWNRARSGVEIRETMHKRLSGKDDGLVGYWPLNEGVGCLAHDKSTNENHGELKPDCPEESPEWVLR